MARLLVTGGSGYLGAVLAARAVAGGWDVVATHHAHQPAVAAGVRDVALDVRDGRAVEALLATERPAVVVHTAYVQDGAAARAVNVEGSQHVAQAARAVGARLVHLSSDAIFRGGGDPARPLREDEPVDPVTAYGATKAAAEEAVRVADPGALLVRTSLIYGGPGAPPSKHERVALAAARGEARVTFFEDELRSPVQVGDLAAALLELAELEVAGPLHVAGADAVDRLAFARLIAAAAGADAAALRGGPAPPGRPRACALDSARAQALLRTRLRGVHEVLRPGGGMSAREQRR